LGWDTPGEYHEIVDHEFVEGRLLLRRTAEEREPILQRLRRIEGQVRGLQQMLEQDRYCLDEIQQANAIGAAVREVILLISSQHLAAGVEHARQNPAATEVLDEVKAVLRAAIRQT
jgi:DNA-binding FrmR family transcriptional regulator